MSRGYKAVRVRHSDALSRISWQDFENRVAQHFRGLGYRVEHTGTGGSAGFTDGGIDLKVYRDHEYIVVQCKHWNAFQVPHNDVHQLIGVMQTEQATSAIVVTSGEFTKAAIDASLKYPQIRLVDGVMIRAMLGFIPEPSYPFPIGDIEPSWNRRIPRTSGKDIRPFVGASAAAFMLAITLMTLYLYYTSQIARASEEKLAQEPTATFAASHLTASTMPIRHAALTRFAPSALATADDNAIHVDTTPSTETDLATWKQKNAQAMKILEQTTPEL